MVKSYEGYYNLRLKVRERRDSKEDVEKADRGRKYEDWFEKQKCTLLIKVECWNI